MITLNINGKRLQGRDGWTILDAARWHGIEIPTLCRNGAAEPYGGCRLCTVEVDDGRRSRVVASCLYPIKNGLKVWTHSDPVNVVRHRRLLQLLDERPGWDRLQSLAKVYGVPTSWLWWRSPWPALYR